MLLLSHPPERRERPGKPGINIFWSAHTDCHYFADGQRRLAAWKNNGWKRSDGKELRNLDLWQEIEELLRPHAVQFHIENMELYKNENERHPC